MAAWTYDAAAKKYRDPSTGRFLSSEAVARLRDAYLAAQGDRMSLAASRLAAGEITTAVFEREMRGIVKDAHGAAYALGRGGRHAMAPSDWGRVGRAVRDQYAYLHRFAGEIAEGTLSDDAVLARSRLYAGAAVAQYERGRVASFSGLRLPRVPGDGKTACLANCRCRLDIVETSTAWRVTWRLSPAVEHCEDCPPVASEWSPKVFAKES